MADVIGTALIQIEPSTEGISGSIEKTLNGEASKAGKSAGSALSGALGGALKGGAGALAALGTAAATTGKALFDAASETAQYGDTIDKASQKMGVSAEFYQEWDAVLQHSGTSMGAMTNTFKTLSNAVQDGSKDQIAAFEKLGLSMEQLSQMSTEQVFEEVVKGLQGMEEGTERTALASDLLGRGAMEMGALFNTSAEDTQKMIDTVHELGGVMDDVAVKNAAAFQDSMQDLSTAFEGVKNSAMNNFLPGITTVMDGLSDLLSGQKGATDKLQEGFQNIITNIVDALPTLLDGFMSVVGPILEMAPELLSALATGIIGLLPTLLPQLTEIILNITTMLVQLLPQLYSGLIDGIVATLPMIIAMLPELLMQIANALINSLPVLIQGVAQIMTMLAQNLPELIISLIEALPDLIQQICDAVVENLPLLIDAAIELVAALVVALPDIIMALIEAIPKIIASVVTAIVKCAPKFLEAAVKLLESFKKGFEKIKDIGKNIIEGLWNGINNAKDWLIGKIKSFCSSALGAIKDFFGIHSPSKVLADEVGKFLPAGIAVGIDANADSAINAMDDLGNRMNTTLSGRLETVGTDAKYGMQIETTSTRDNQLFDMLAEYLPQIAQGNSITLEGDMKKMFRAVKKQNDIYRKSNGRSAFA